MTHNPIPAVHPASLPGLGTRRQRRAERFAKGRWMVDVALGRNRLVAHLCADLKRLCGQGFRLDQPCDAPPGAHPCRACLKCAKALGLVVSGAEVGR